MGYWVTLFLICGLLAFLGQTTGQQVNIPGPNGLVVVVNTTGYGVNVTRILPPAQTTMVTATTTSTTTRSTPSTTSTSTMNPTSTTTTSPRPTTPPPQITTGPVAITVTGIREIGNNSSPITAHSIAPASLALIGYAQTSTTVSNLLPASTVYAICTQFSATILATAVLNASVCTVQSNGTITLGNETETVSVGQLYLSVLISQWQWCNGCATGQEGTYLDVDFAVKIARSRSVTLMKSAVAGIPTRYSLGVDAYVDFSTKVTIDGQVMSMPLTTPTLNATAGGSAVTLTVRLPHFVNTALYTQVVEPGYQPAPPPQGSNVVGGAEQLSVNISKLSILALVALVWAVLGARA